MPGPARRYTGLHNDVPSMCLDKMSPWYRLAPVVVESPYENVNDVVVEIDGILGPWESSLVHTLFMPMADTISDLGPGTIGWYTDAEMDLLSRVRARIVSTKNEAASIGHPHAGEMKALIDDALAQNDFIFEEYETWAKMHYVTEDWGVLWGPLDRAYDDFEAHLWRDYYTSPGIDLIGDRETYLEENRRMARTSIREAWDHMLSVLWCGEVWMAAIEAEKANKAIYFENEADRTGTFATKPQTGKSASGQVDLGRTFQATQSAQAATVANSSIQGQTASIRATRTGEESSAKGSGLILLAATVGVAFLLSRGK
jgi:hypothetical protein